MECWSSWASHVEGVNLGTWDVTMAMDLQGMLCFHFSLSFHQQSFLLLTPLARIEAKLFWNFVEQISMRGEDMSLHMVRGSSSVKWVLLAPNRSHTWYKAILKAPPGNAPLALEIWVAWERVKCGQSFGSHCPAYIAQGSCGACYYAYTENKCRTNCGQPSQRW